MVGYVFLTIFWHGHTNLWESLYIAPGAFGTGVIASSLFVYLAAGVDDSQMAIASTGLYLGQNIGALLGLSLASNVLFNVLRSGLEKRLDGFPNREMVRRTFPAQLVRPLALGNNQVAETLYRSFTMQYQVLIMSKI